jgi:hypothetical protein
MACLEEWPSSTEFGLQARLRDVAPVFFTEDRGRPVLRFVNTAKKQDQRVCDSSRWAEQRYLKPVLWHQSTRNGAQGTDKKPPGVVISLLCMTSVANRFDIQWPA